ncbi:MAG: PepSY domain-containing protein, partial [Alphaproteobacteria bacterium]|nr:PepSY domain-containing protein [Alphaproteobacteria bacterium]
MAELPPDMVANTLGRNVGGGRRWRWLLQQLHLWTGVVLCVPLVLLGLTGSIAVFQDELSDLTDPRPRAQIGAMKGPAAIIAAAAAKAPASAQPTVFMAPEAPGEPASVRFAQRDQAPGPGGVRVFVDPVSLEVLGTREGSAGLVRRIRN